MRASILDEEVIGMFEKDLFTLQMIADSYGVSKTSVMKYLNRHGVDTSKRLREVSCSNPKCEKKILRTKKRARETKLPFCSSICYFEFIKNPKYQESRQGQRIGREVIQKMSTIENFVVHHVDGNDLKNSPKNLWAFKTQGDHMRFHRGGKCKAFILSKMSWVDVEGKKIQGRAEGAL